MTVLDAYLASLTECLTPDVARWLVEFRPDDLTQQRLEYLRQGANAGTLTEAERAEYEEFVETLDFVGVLKHHARTTVRLLQINAWRRVRLRRKIGMIDGLPGSSDL